jgi:hypothetical protein
MNKLLTGITISLIITLFIGTSSGGFVDEQTVWNDPDWTTESDIFGCMFCSNPAFTYDKWINPALSDDEPEETPLEFEEPAPAVMPKPLPYTKGDITSLLDRLSIRTLPSQNYSKHVFNF